MKRTGQSQRTRRGRTLHVTLRAVALLALGAGTSWAQFSDAPASRATPFAATEEVKVKGVIVQRSSPTDFIIRDETDAMRVISVGDQTEIKSPSGLWHMGTKKWDASVLRPGLIIIAEGVGANNGALVATEIAFRSKDLGIVNQIEGAQMQLWAANAQLKTQQDQLRAEQEKTDARVTATQDSLSQTRDSLARLTMQVASIDTYEERMKSVVNFRTGSAMLTPESKATLDKLVADSRDLSGYVLEVDGHTDAVGSNALNRRLSERRADAVVEYLTAISGVPARRVAIPTANGETRPTASNTTREGRAQNRRTEVIVLVSRGLEARRGVVISSRQDR